MDHLSDMIWIEYRKALRSRMPLWTALGSLFMPLGIAFLIFVSKNPQISQKLGIVSAKANLMAYSATDWPAYMGLYGQIVASGGFILFILILSWIFGREFSDGTIKDMLAVPVRRAGILMAKFIVAALWSEAMTLVIFSTGLVMGVLLGLPGASLQVFLHGFVVVVAGSSLMIFAVSPFALFASAGRGYLLPIGLAVLMMILINLVMILGWGEFFPWSVPLLFAEGKIHLRPVSYYVVALTGLAGMVVTHLWWKFSDQSR
jgi:ABC-2 type transport system permease protein